MAELAYDDELDLEDEDQPKRKPPQPESVGTPLAGPKQPVEQETAPIGTTLTPPTQEPIGQPLQLQPGPAARPAYERYESLSAQKPTAWHDLGIGGKIGRVAETIGTAINPNIVAAIPGTEPNRQRRLAGARTAAEQEIREVGSESLEAQRGAQARQAEVVPIKVPWQEEPVYVERKDAAQLEKQIGANAGKQAVATTTQEGATRRTEETNKSKEGIAEKGNESKEKISTARNESNELIQQRHDSTKRAIAMANLDEKRLQGKKAPPEVAKAHETMQGSISRMNVMQRSYEDALRDPSNQQAMLNLLANHLGMTMGLAKGARINQAMINEAERSGLITERVEAHFDRDGYLTGLVLTPRQMGQMVDLARNRLDEDRRNLRETEQYYGFEGQNEPTTPATNAPPRPKGVPEGAVWNEKVRRWQMPTNKPPQ